MAGGTLVISREVKNHDHFKKRFEALGFRDVTVSACEKDALNFLIRDKNPSLLIMGASFYECCTPFLMGELHKMFPHIKMAAVHIGHYPEDIAMSFILNGVASYVTSFDGIDQFYKGLDDISRGGEFISVSVQEKIDLRQVYPEPALNMTDRLKETIRLACCGFTDDEIGDTLHISKGTVENYKTKIFTSLNVRSCIELIRAALTLEIIRLEELYFYPRGLTVNPRPDKQKEKVRGKR